MEALFSQFSVLEIVVCGLAVLAFLSQVFTYLGYSLIAKHRHHSRPKDGETPPAVSIVIVVEESISALEEMLPKLLEQNYNGEWEVVIVNDCGGADVENALMAFEATSERVRQTTIRADDRFKHSRKIPLLVGVKASKYPNIIVADPVASPESDKWLSLMARGFVGGELVIGYTGFEDGTQGLVRAWNFMIGMRYLRAAVVSLPYRGVYSNIGYTKDIFFKCRGYNFLRLSTGEDDLFVQKIAPYCEHSVILNPKATMRQKPSGGFKWWWRELRYRSFSFRYYPKGVKFSIFFELFSKFMLFGFLIWAALLPIANVWIYAISLFVVREVLLVLSVRNVMKRVGERKLIPAFLIYDLLSPVLEATLVVLRRIKPSLGLWK